MDPSKVNHLHNVRGPETTCGRGHKWSEDPWRCEDAVQHIWRKYQKRCLMAFHMCGFIPLLFCFVYCSQTIVKYALAGFFDILSWIWICRWMVRVREQNSNLFLDLFQNQKQNNRNSVQKHGGFLVHSLLKHSSHINRAKLSDFNRKRMFGCKMFFFILLH